MTLAPELNRVPDGIRHIHVMGICGTGMAALAGLLQEAGFVVTGSDTATYPPMSLFLAEKGIPVAEGYRAANLDPRPDLVVVGNVIRATNPEAQALAALAVPYLSMPQALGHFFLAGARSLVVAGTHGKTTTSSLLASVLHHAGLTPGFLIGGLVQGFGANHALGGGQYFVVEGDEYDTAFFDKGPKFLHYRPGIAILTSIEFDHADIYADLAAVEAAFRRLVGILPADGGLVAWGDDPKVRAVAAGALCPVELYGEGPANDWRLAAVEPQGTGSRFAVEHRGQAYGTFVLPMPGRHNAANALAVIAVLHRLGLAPEAIAAGLASFAGVRRRQEVRGTEAGVTVIDDFAHHPTAVRVTLAGLRQAYPGRRLVVVFEPRTNTSRRNIFQAEYAAAFGDADRVLLREPLPMDGLPASERFSSARLAADLAAAGQQAASFADTGAILADLGTTLRPGDLVAILSNGGFDNIHQRLLAQLRAQAASFCPPA
ncbi:MAG: UDP-N-acetylmuramate:L-alanyl-gamma-D-glutamyl-meso-diaminopimelate ligase [Thermodesulfobacteriota bacterium]